MEFLKWYLIVGVIVNIIAEIYNVKKYEGDSFTGIIIDTWKAEKSIMARSKLIIEYICVFMIACILWLPAIVFGIVYVIKERLNK